MDRAEAIPEKSVLAIWQRKLTGRTDLTTEEGDPIRIIYPGRINDDRGADLRDAVILSRRGLLKGDIEVHVKSSSWWAHRHHQDSFYNRVILHVVFWHDTEAAVSLQNGQKVPTLALHRFIDHRSDRQDNEAALPADGPMPCRHALGFRHEGVIGELLDIAGEEWFQARAAGFQAAIAQSGPGQSLYRGIMGALGYTKNKGPLSELAERVPLHVLESVTPYEGPDDEFLAQRQARLLGKAGLLPSQRSERFSTGNRGDEWVDKLEKAWASSGQPDTMSAGDWHLFKVRPSNFPSRRIAAMSYLLLRYREKGIFEGLVNRLHEAAVDSGCHLLAGALRVTSTGYWANHLDLGLPGGKGPPRPSRRRASL